MRLRAGWWRRGEVGEGVDLLHVPGAGGCGDDEAGEVEEREAKDGVPGEGVADAAVEGVGLVLVEAEDVGCGFGAGEFSAICGYACADEDQQEPGQVAASEAVGEEREGKRAGSEEEDPYPEGPVCRPIEACVALADFAGVGVFQLAGVLHGVSFAEVWGRVNPLMRQPLIEGHLCS